MDKTQDQFEILLDIEKNKPVIVKHTTKEVAKKGLICKYMFRRRLF